MSLLSTINSACSKGCIACDTSSDECLMCDPLAFYQMDSDGNCVESKISDCLVGNSSEGESKCVQCSEGMLFDATQKKCVTVPNNVVVNDCQFYNQAGECLICMEAHYISNGKCLPAAIQVDGCLLFTEANFCSVCEKGKRFNNDIGKCVSFNQISGCSVHAFATCDECLHGYHKEKSLIYSSIGTSSLTSASADMFVFYNNDISFQGDFRTKGVSNCREIEFQGCATYDIQDGRVVGCATCSGAKYLDASSKNCVNYPAVQIQNCVVYSSNTVCYQCAENFYATNSGTECTAVTTITGCTIYERDENKCKQCEDDKFVAQPGADSCSSRATFPIPNCETHSLTSDECTTCVTGFRASDERTACLDPILNCGLYEASPGTPTELLCATCNEHWFVDSNKKACTVQDIPNCRIHVDNEDNCEICIDGYYLSGTTKIICEKKNIAGCDTYVTAQENMCENCQMKFSKEADGTCTALADTKCVRNTVNTTTCEACERGFYLNSTTCEASNKTYDPKCVEVTDDGKCVKCVYDHQPFQLDMHEVSLPSNCLTGDASNQDCTACKDNMDAAFDATVTTSLNCTAASTTSGKCQRLKPATAGTLGDNDGDCDLCRNKTDHYLDSNTCNDRTPYTKHNCASFFDESNNCQFCEENTHSIYLDEGRPLCLTPPTDFTLTEMLGCRVMDFFNDGNCLQCLNGKTHTDGSPDTCTDDGVDDPHDWDLFHIDIGSSLVPTQGIDNEETAIDNCARHYYSYEDATLYCAECKATFTPIVNMETESNHSYYPTTDGYLTNSNLMKITECKTMTDANYMQYVQNTALTISSSCKAATEIGTANSAAGNYVCVSCGVGFVGKVKLFNYDNVGGDATGWSSFGDGVPQRVGYGECTSTSELTISNKFSGMTNLDEGFYTRLSDVLYDTCSDSSKNVVHIRNSGSPNSNTYTMGVEGPAGSERVNTICHVIPAQGKVDNCQVYHLPTDSAATRDFSLSEDYKCLVCKPGHYFPSGEEGTKCLPIENCDLTQTNTWLGQCQTCDSGFAWPINTSDRQPNLGKCSPNSDSTETNCMINQSSGSTGKCVMCKVGKTMDMDSYKCVDYPSYCGSNGFPDNNLIGFLSSSFNGNVQAKDVFSNIFRGMFLDNYKLGPGLCSTCGGSRKLYNAQPADDDKVICVNDEIKRNLIEGCVKYTGNLIDKCAECSVGYVLKSNGSECYMRSSSPQLLHCSIATNSSSCSTCSPGYRESNGVCSSEHNCLDSNDSSPDSSCEMCKDGFARDNGDPHVCEEYNGLLSTKCLSLVYPNNNNDTYCRECKDCNQTPVMKLNVSIVDGIQCVNNDSSYNLDGYMFFYDKNGDALKGQWTSKKKSVDSGKYLSTLFQDGSDMPEYVCVREPVDVHCNAWDHDGYECTSCNDGYYVDFVSKNCFKIAMEGCRTVNSSGNCISCYTTASEESMWKVYYRSGITCYENTAANCVDGHDNMNKCTICRNGYHLDDDDECQPNTVATNCQKAVTNTDECEICAEKYYLDGVECKPHTVTNCTAYSTTSNSCIGCIENYYSSGSNCLLHTAPDCATKSTNSNSCLTCSETNHFPIGELGCMEQPTIEGCQTYNTSSQGCSVCSTGYYESSDTCFANPSGIENCVTYSSATTCTSCVSTHFLDGAVCTEVTTTVTDCAVYSANGVCSACIPDRFLAVDGTSCSAVNENSCLTWVDVDNCASCAGNNVLKTNADSKVQCVSSGLDHCVTPVAGEPNNTCTKCADGFILRSAECVAPKISINNCRVYDEPTEDCVECYPGNLLSADKKSCLSKIAEAGDYCSLGHIESDTEPSCNLCDFGQIMNENGSCEACGGEGCFICDVTDLTKCKICMTQYYMSSSGTCSLNNPPEPISVPTLRLFSMVLLLIVFWKKD